MRGEVFGGFFFRLVVPWRSPFTSRLVLLLCFNAWVRVKRAGSAGRGDGVLCYTWHQVLVFFLWPMQPSLHFFCVRSRFVA